MSLEDVAEKNIEHVFGEKTELAAVFDNLDDDRLSTDSLLSNIDFNTRLSDEEIRHIMVVDELRRFGILPSEVNITRVIKRLNVSKHGMGREEKVRIVAGEREHQSNRSFLGKLFSRKE